MSPFRPLSEHELDRLDDDHLIAYIRDAHDAREHRAAELALAVLVFGHWRNVERRVALKLPAEHVEDQTAAIIERAVASAFDGESIGQFVNWLKTIADRAIADFFRRGPGARPRVAVLGTGEDELDLPAPDGRGVVETRAVIELVLAGLGERDRAVVEMLVFEDLPASAAVVAIPGLTEANAHQIVSRFRRALRRALESEGDTS